MERLFAGYRVFSHDVMAAILVSQNNETAAMLVSQTSPLGVDGDVCTESSAITDRGKLVPMSMRIAADT